MASQEKQVVTRFVLGILLVLLISECYITSKSYQTRRAFFGTVPKTVVNAFSIRSCHRNCSRKNKVLGLPFYCIII